MLMHRKTCLIPILIQTEESIKLLTLFVSLFYSFTSQTTATFMGDGHYITMKKVQSTKGLNSCTHPKIGTSSYNHKMFGAN